MSWLGPCERPEEAGPALRRTVREPALWVLLASILCLISPVLVGDRTLFFRDLHLQYASTARVVHELVTRREVRLWDPLLNGGQSLIGNPDRFLLYPSHLLYAFLPPVAGLNWEIALHLLLGAAGCYLLARKVSCAAPAAAFAGGVFALGGFSLSLTVFLESLFAYHWIPWLVLASHQLSTTGRRRWWVLLAAAGGVQWLSCGVEMVVLGYATLLAWQLALAKGWRDLARKAAVTVSAAVAAAGLAAAELLPAAATVACSSRPAGTPAEALVWSVHPRALVELVLAGVLGPLDCADPASRYWGAGVVDLAYPYVLTLYVGVVPFALAFCAVAEGAAGGRRRLRLVLGTMLLLSVVASCGRFVPGVSTVVQALPFLAVVRFPVKLQAAAELPLALLAGMAATGLAGGRGVARARARRVFLLCTAVLAAILGGLLLAGPRAEGTLGAFFRTPRPGMLPGVVSSVASATLTVAVVTLIVVVPRGLSLHARLWLLTAVMLTDLGLAGRQPLMTAPRQLLSDPPPLLEVIQQSRGEGRLYRGPDPPLMHPRLPEDSAAATAVWRISILESYVAAGYGVPMIFHPDDPRLAQRRISRLGDLVQRLPWPKRLRLLSAAGVSCVVTPDRVQLAALETIGFWPADPRTALVVYHNRDYLGVAWFVAGACVAATEDLALAAVTRDDFEPARQVVLEAPPSRAQTPATAGMAILTWHVRQADLWLLDVTAPTSGYLVLAEPWDPGWRTWVNGEARTAVRANYAFTAIPIDAGRSRVRRVYRPLAALVGMGVSALSLLTVLAVALCRRGERRASA